MPVTLIVLVHPEPKSFNAQWAKASARASASLGHEVIWSDLYAQGFVPAEAATHYEDPIVPFDPLKAQAAASARGLLPHDVANEIIKIKRADRIIFHFPMWWFSAPAMLKGWFDRVLAHGSLHDVDHRFDNGHLKGKRALFCVTTGSTQAESSPNGREGDASMLLWPSAYTLRYCGIDVCQPVFVHGVHGYHRDSRLANLQSKLNAVLDQQSLLIAQMDALPLIGFNAETDFDDNGQLKPDANSLSPFISHRK